MAITKNTAYLKGSLWWSVHTVMVHDVVFELGGHLRVNMAALVLADVGERLGSTKDAVVEAREDIALK